MHLTPLLTSTFSTLLRWEVRTWTLVALLMTCTFVSGPLVLVLVLLIVLVGPLQESSYFSFEQPLDTLNMRGAWPFAVLRVCFNRRRHMRGSAAVCSTMTVLMLLRRMFLPSTLM